MIKQFSTLLLSLIISLTVVTYAIACGCCGSQSNNNAEVKQTPEQLISDTQMVEEKVQCPVMKTWILPSEAADSTEYNGKTYYFCCGGCKDKFLSEPEKYIENQS